MRRLGLLLPVLCLLSLTLPGGPDAWAGSGPGEPVWPRQGQVDAALHEKARRIQGGMWWHLSPGGLLVEKHRTRTGAAGLDHEVLAVGDAAIWTGCYAASQVARWKVTHDPDALNQIRHLARGLTALSEASGTRGRLVRSVGRPEPGRKPHAEAMPSPRRDGRWIRPDISRDQLAGVTLGWFWIGRFLEGQPDLQALAARQLGDIAKRLDLDGMWLRDWRGRQTKHGELRKTHDFMPLMNNGIHSAIALATVLGAATLNPKDPDLRALAQRLLGKGWTKALDDQHTFFASSITNSNVFMTVISLLVLTRVPHEETRKAAWQGLTELRKATVGWWNAGLCAAFLAAGMRDAGIVGELRATLHDMPEDPTPPVGVQILEEKDIVPIRLRSRITGWAWKENLRLRQVQPVNAPSNPNVTFTRADWLFAYWLACSAGVLEPEHLAPNRDPRVALDLPPWMKPKRLPSFGGGAAAPPGWR